MRDRDKYNTYQREYQRERAKRWKIYAIEKLGSRCAWCESTDDLEIDHIDWRTKTERSNNLWSIAKSRSDAELQKCQLLCHDCHAVKTARDLSEIKHL